MIINFYLTQLSMNYIINLFFTLLLSNYMKLNNNILQNIFLLYIRNNVNMTHKLWWTQWNQQAECPRRQWSESMGQLMVSYKTPTLNSSNKVVQRNMWSHVISWANALIFVIRCATCHNLIGDQQHRSISSRNMPRVTFWLAVSFQITKFTAYK